MRFIIFLFLSFTIFTACNQKQSYQPTNLTKVTEEQLIKDAQNHHSPNLAEIVFKNTEGEIIDPEALQKIIMDDSLVPDFYQNDEGIVVEAVIRKVTNKDIELRKKLQAAFNKGPEVNSVEINCENKKQILNEVYDSDQGMRSNGAAFNPKIDHQNLEIIISIIEKCGLPTLKEVNKKEMSAVWLVLQHAPARYQSQYIPMLEKAAEQGDIEWGAIALMKDRALMNEGKPQIYGSQVSGDELYNLREPEYVNQRRAEMDMEPIEDYLKRFGIDFTIKQITK